MNIRKDKDKSELINKTMEFENTPSSERKLVYFIEKSNYNNLQYHDEGKELLTNPEVLIVPLNESDNFLDNYSIIEEAYPYDGMLITISPYDNTKYSEITNANDNFCMEKFMNIITLCHIVGAKNINIDQIHTDITNTDTNNNGEANYNVVKASIDKKSTFLNEKINKILLNTTFSGGKCDYEEAQRFLRKKRLASDPVLSSLVEMRSASNNEIRNFSQVISLSNNNEGANSVLAKINFPAGGANFSRTSKRISTQKYYLELSIEF